MKTLKICKQCSHEHYFVEKQETSSCNILLILWTWRYWCNVVSSRSNGHWFKPGRDQFISSRRKSSEYETSGRDFKCCDPRLRFSYSLKNFKPKNTVLWANSRGLLHHSNKSSESRGDSVSLSLFSLAGNNNC